MAIYVTTVEFLDGRTEELRDYRDHRIVEGVAIFHWSDSTVTIPLGAIRMMAQTEEPA